MDDTKVLRHFRKHLTELINATSLALNQLDALMKQPSTYERGQNIAKVLNNLDLANDRAKHFGLGLDLRNRKAIVRKKK